MIRVGKVQVELELTRGVRLDFKDKLEVSLDCSACQRRCRTVVFPSKDDAPFCTPTRHEFAGKLLSVQSEETGTTFEFQYEFESFVDTKYPNEQRYSGIERGAPTWARAWFSATCPACGKNNSGSTQSNIVRPSVERCICGKDLFKDLHPPALSWTET